MTSYRPQRDVFDRVTFPRVLDAAVNGGAEFLVAEQDARVVGYVLALRMPTLFAGGTVLEVLELTVDAPLRGGGTHPGGGPAASRLRPHHEMALGAVKALGSKAGKSVQVVGFDGTPDGLTAVRNGTLYASVAQQPTQLGRIAVDNALKAVRGKKVEPTVKVPVKVVTKDNVAGFSG